MTFERLRAVEFTEVRYTQADWVIGSRPTIWRRTTRTACRRRPTGAKPVIGRLNGMPVGGGNQSHLACDLSVIAEHAYVGQVGMKVGSVAAGGATQWLPIFASDRRARRMLAEPASPTLPGVRVGSGRRGRPSVVNDGDADTQSEDKGERHHGTV